MEIGPVSAVVEGPWKERFQAPVRNLETFHEPSWSQTTHPSVQRSAAARGRAGTDFNMKGNDRFKR